MKILFFSSDEYVEDFFSTANKNLHYGYDLQFSNVRLNRDTASLAKNHPIVTCWIYDELDAPTLTELSALGVKLVALRTAGFNNVDVQAATELNITVAYVPTYSPYAVAEHAVALILALNRKTHKAYLRVREGNFSLHNLLGFNLHDAPVGVIGTGKIGTAFARIMHGFGCKLFAYDKMISPECATLGVKYLPLEELLLQSAIISLHCPLTPETHHLINANTISLMQKGTMLINTSRGGLIDTKAAVKALKSGKIGYLGLDVYEEEQNLFFNDLSERVIPDEVFGRLQTFPNVLITGHQGFLTKQAYTDIANITLQNITSFIKGEGQLYQVGPL